jgi:predicted NACHT family NTPase
MSNNFSHQTNTGTTVNVVGDHTVVHVSGGPHALTENIRPDVRRFFESLKERYQTRYQSKLDGRFEITLEVSESLDSPRPQRFIERYDKDAEISAAFVAINNNLEKRGRLLITGNPGVGKTVLMLKLAVNLLDNIKSLDKEAFPVVFNLALWSPAYRDFGDWLIAMLVSGYGLSKDLAKTLLLQESSFCSTVWMS